MDNNAKELLARGKRLASRRDTLNSFWQASAELYYPVRANFTSELEWGESFASQLMDSSPVLFHRELSNAFSSYLRPRGHPWFKLDIDDEETREEPGVADWLDSRTTIMRRAMYQSRAQFVRATKEGDGDYGGFGNAVLSVELNDDLSGLLYRCWHLRDCVWADNQFGETDTLFRAMKMSARQMKQKWAGKVHSEVAKACGKDPDKEFNVQHVMLPAADYEYETRKRAPKGARFVSVYIDCDNEHMLSELPSYEFRYVVPRWQMIPGSQYGYSPPVLISLPDARGIQVMARVMLEAGEKAVDPPMVATAEAVLGEINLQASGTTWIDKEYDEKLGEAVRPLMGNAANLAIGVDMLERTRETLKEAWYLNKLFLPQQGERTAYETSQLVEEFIRSNIPLFEPMETTYNAPLLEMTAETLLRVGAFGDPADMPQALGGRELVFAFSNPLQDAIEKNKVFQFQNTVGLVAAAAQFDPTAVKHVDVTKGLRDAVRGSGAPADWIVDQETADAAVEQEKQAMAAMQAVQGVGAAGAAAEQVGKAGQALMPEMKKAA